MHVQPCRHQKYRKPWMMGVLNCTPDSFSDGGQFAAVDVAIAQGLSMWEQGAAWIDVGGESTRPGADAVSLQEELRRVMPVVSALAERGCCVSIDTMKAEVMRQAIAAGACLVNDVSALADEGAVNVVAKSGVQVCLMHMQGLPKSMQDRPQYAQVVDEVIAFLDARVQVCLTAGVKRSAIMIDPGIGFGKSLQDNLALIQSIPTFKQHFDLPILMGVSRKSFLGMISGSDVADRAVETAAAIAVCGYLGADVLRVHDVAMQQRAAMVGAALQVNR